MSFILFCSTVYVGEGFLSVVYTFVALVLGCSSIWREIYDETLTAKK